MRFSNPISDKLPLTLKQVEIIYQIHGKSPL